MKRYFWWAAIILIAVTESGFLFFLSPTQGLFSPSGLILLFLILEIASVMTPKMKRYQDWSKKGYSYPAILGITALLLLELGRVEAAVGLTIWILLASTVIFFLLPKIVHPKYLK